MTRGRPALLLLSALTLVSLLAVGGSSPPSAASAAPAPPAPRQGVVLLFVVDHMSFGELLSVPVVQELARTGGAALMATDENYRTDLSKVYEALGSGVAPAGTNPHLLARALTAHGVEVSGRIAPGGPGERAVTDQVRAILGSVGPSVGTTSAFLLDVVTPTGRADIDREIRTQIAGSAQGRTLVMVVTPTLSPDVLRRGDEVTPIVMAEARSDRLLTATGPLHALASDTTRQKGLVANVDVAPTVLGFFGIPIPSEMDGQAIRASEDEAPFDLYRLELEQRRIRLPIQLAEVAFVSAIGLVAMALLVAMGRGAVVPGWTREAMAFLALCGVAFPVSLLAGGLLPRLTYAVVVPFLVVATVGLAALARQVRRPPTVGPFLFLGAVGLAMVVVDAVAFRGRAMRLPLLGGVMFDGVRYFGLPNAFIALLMASSLFLAVALRPFPGFALLFAVGLFAGFPSLGANIGASATLFAAAGLWWVLRTRPRFGLREVAFVAGLIVVGAGLVLLANRYLPGAPTHATRLVERAGSRFGTAWAQLRRRLGVGLRQLNGTPAAYLPVLGLPVVLAVLVKRPDPVGPAVDLTGQAWRDALIALTAASVVAFFANDTGVAAAAPAFLYVMAGIAYPVFLNDGRMRAEGGLPAR